MASTLLVAKLLGRVGRLQEPSRPYRLIELYYSVEGPRSRVCGGTWETAEEAEQFGHGLLDGQAAVEGEA